ncbi:MAG: LysR family transcriptional regulator [Myxococcota bacterium]
MNRLGEIAVFVRVVRSGSFTTAARELGISKSYASKQVRALETRLGAQLLLRTTRAVHVTDAGRAFALRCTEVLDSLNEAEHEVAALQDAPVGTLTVSAPVSFGVSHVAPVVAQFMATHPELRVVLELTDARVDVVEGGYDLVVRLGALSDSSLLAKRVSSLDLGLVASASYLAERGRPEHPDDLRGHDGLNYGILDTPSTWTLRHLQTNAIARIRMKERMLSNNGQALLEAAKAGCGVASLPLFMIETAIANGEIERVLADWSTMDSSAATWLVFPPNRHQTAKVKLLVDALSASFSTL